MKDHRKNRKGPRAEAPALPALARPDARDLRVALVVSVYHGEVTGALAHGARDAFRKAGGDAADIVEVAAPGAFELPALAAACARRGDIAAVVALGCVVRGQTRHDRYICEAVSNELARLSVDSGKPVGFGLLTVENIRQARERAGGDEGNKGEEAMNAALIALAAMRALGAAAKGARA